MSSNIIFSFDGEAVGAIAAVEGMASALENLISIAEGVVSSFANIANSSATMMSAWGALMNNIGSLTGGLQDSGAAMGGASKSASDLAYQLQRLGEQAANAAQKHSEAVAQIQQQEADLTAKTQTEISRREASYTESLAKAVQSHQDALEQIAEQQQTLNENYSDQMDATLRKLNNPVEQAHQQTLTALETQLAALLSSGQAGSAAVAQLESQITAENSKYQSFLDTTIKPYYQYLDQKNYDHHQTALEQLQDRLTKENRDYTQHTQDLKTQLDQQLSDINDNYTKQERNLEEHLSRENESYAQQLQSIAEQRQHLLTNAAFGGGGAGGGGVGALPPTAKTLWLYDMLGIDPHSDAIAAENALMTWITGGQFKYKGTTTDFGMGQDTESQMTLPQIFTIVSQAINYGQDPTKATHGKENYVNLFSDLLALSGVGKPGLDEGTRFNSLTNIMEKVMTGQTYGLNRQLMNVGIDPELLGKYGVKFGGTKGETVENPEALFGALMNYAYERAPGLGEYQAHHTPMGLVNLIKDWWSSIVFGVTGNINDPGSLIAKFTEQFNRFVGFLYQHRPEIEAFGRTVATWLVDKFKQFNDWLNSADAKKKLDDIGHALHDIGDALHWMSQHKDIVLAVMGLLGVQVGSKIVGGLGGGLVSGVMKGGLFGAIGQGALGIGGMFTGFPGGGGGGEPGGRSWLGDFKAMRQVFKSGKGPLSDAMSGVDVGANEGFFSWIAHAFGNSGGATRAAAFSMNPLGTAGIIGRQTMGTVGRTVGRGAMRVAGGLDAGLNFAEGVATNVGASYAGGGGTMAGGIFNVLKSLPAILPALSGLGPALGGIAAAAGPITLVVAAIAGLAFVIFQNRDKIMPVLKQLASFFQQQFSGVAKAVTGFVHEVGSRLHDTFGPGSLVYNILNKLSQFWSGAWGGIKLAFTGVWDIISGVFKIAWSIISNIILLGMDLLSGKWGKAWKDIQNLVGGVWDGIKQAIGGALKLIGGVIWGFFGGLWNMISQPLTGFWNSLTKFFGGIPDAIGKAMSGLGSAISKQFEELKELPHTIFKFIIDHAGPLAGPLQGLAHTLGIPGYAAGGQYPGGQVAKVGERGQELFFSGYQGLFVNNARIRAAMNEVSSPIIDGMQGGYGRGRGIYIANLNLPGVRNAQDFYRELNTLSGRYAEYGNRAGLP